MLVRPSDAEGLEVRGDGYAALPDWMRVFNEPGYAYVLHGGRGSGKSWGAALYCLEYARAHSGALVLCTREIQKNIGESSWRTLRKLIRQLGWGSIFEVQATRIQGINGSEFVFRGLSESHGTAESVKSLEGVDLTWVEQAEALTEESLDLLMPTVLRRARSHVVFTLNPREPDGAVYQRYVLGDVDGAVVRQVNRRDNPWFPARLEPQRAWTERHRPIDYRHVYEGEPRLAVAGALWSLEMITEARLEPEDYAALPDPDDVVVAVDPAFSRGERSDNTGIVVVARIGRDGYVLHAERGKFTSPVWSRRAVALLREFGASRVVIEARGADDPLLDGVRQVDSAVPVAYVNPSGKGSKFDRATPVAGLYVEHFNADYGRLHHVGKLSDLEGEQLSFTLDSVRDDLVDALVWGCDELGLIRNPPLWTHPAAWGMSRQEYDAIAAGVAAELEAARGEPNA